MKKIMSLVLVLAMVLAFSGCSQQNEEISTISDGRLYVMEDCDVPLAPYVILDGKTDEGKFSFTYSAISSDAIVGKYHTSNSELILNDDRGHIYTFMVDGNNLIFDADKSEGYITIVDGSIFSLKEN